MNNNNGQMGQDTPDAGLPAIKAGAKGLFDSLKTPVFWLAIGFIACKFLDRKKG